MFSKPKQKNSAQKRKERKKQDEGKAKMTKLDTFFTQIQATQAKASVEASGSLLASSVNEAALTLPPRPASLDSVDWLYSLLRTAERTLDLSSIVNDFAEHKARKMSF